MKTLHRWFESGNDSLLGHIDLPELRGPAGVVIVPPFGWENVCSYRPLRFLARSLAEHGIPVLRYDPPGMDNSSGGATDAGLLDAWVRSVDAAASELRAAGGVQEVAIFGIRMGGLIAALAAGRGANVQDLILWGTAGSGRAELRELRAYANMERWEFASDTPTPPQPIPGFEVGGFLISPDTQRDLEAVDLSRLSQLGGRRVLVLARDEVAPDAKLVRTLESAGASVRVRNGPGYSSMMTQPHEALPPAGTTDAIVEFLAGAAAPAIQHAHSAQPPATTCIVDSGNAPVMESVYTVRSGGGAIFGILSEPVPNLPRGELCVLFLNAGGARDSGPNRMWVEAARRHAARGIASLRFDLSGIGESDGAVNLDIPGLYQERLVEQVEEMMDSLRSRAGFRRFAAIGLCSGAFWAFHAAIRNRDICAAVLLNPRLFFWDPEVDRRRLMRRGAKGLVSPSDWWRVMRGGVRADDVKRAMRIVLGRSQGGNLFSPRQIPPDKIAHAWKTLQSNRTRLTIAFTEGEPLLREMEEENQLPDESNSRIRVVRFPHAGHTFRPKWAQRMAHDLIDRELDFASRGDSGDRVADRVVHIR